MLRVGGYVDQHLGWGRGSVLTRLTESGDGVGEHSGDVRAEERCSRPRTYRDPIECGESRTATRLPSLPREPTDGPSKRRPLGGWAARPLGGQDPAERASGRRLHRPLREHARSSAMGRREHALRPALLLRRRPPDPRERGAGEDAAGGPHETWQGRTPNTVGDRCRKVPVARRGGGQGGGPAEGAGTERHRNEEGLLGAELFPSWC